MPTARAPHPDAPSRPPRLLLAGLVLGLLAGAPGCGDVEEVVLTEGNAAFLTIGVADAMVQSRQNEDVDALPDIFSLFDVSPAAPAAGAGSAPEPDVPGCETGSYTESQDGTVLDFDDCYVDGCVVDGGVTFSLDEETADISLAFDDFLGVCDSGEQMFLGDSTLTCSGFLEFMPVCEIELDTPASFDFLGRISGAELSADELVVEHLETGFYTFNGSIYYPGYGRVWFESTSEIGFGACYGNVPSSGELEVVGAIQGVKANVMFLGCDWFSVCYDDGVHPVERCAAHLWRDWMPAEEE